MDILAFAAQLPSAGVDVKPIGRLSPASVPSQGSAGNHPIGRGGSNSAKGGSRKGPSAAALAAATEAINVSNLHQPRFLKIYEKYKEVSGEVSCESDHLMARCLCNLVPFCLWVRSSDETMSWIREIIEDNADFRPEVRNGLAMLLIYAIATAKAVERGSSMFHELQESSGGLGIVNKSSLKIYNDPFKYFSFLKCCITGLIDAGEIRENDRVNQPRKTNRGSIPVNIDEIASYRQMLDVVLTMFARGEVAVICTHMDNILELWQRRHKSVLRGKRFAVALSAFCTASVAGGTAADGVTGTGGGLNTLGAAVGVAQQPQFMTLLDKSLPITASLAGMPGVANAAAALIQQHRSTHDDGALMSSNTSLAETSGVNAIHGGGRREGGGGLSVEAQIAVAAASSAAATAIAAAAGAVPTQKRWRIKRTKNGASTNSTSATSSSALEMMSLAASAATPAQVDINDDERAMSLLMGLHDGGTAVSSATAVKNNSNNNKNNNTNNNTKSLERGIVTSGLSPVVAAIAANTNAANVGSLLSTVGLSSGAHSASTTPPVATCTANTSATTNTTTTAAVVQQKSSEPCSKGENGEEFKVCGEKRSVANISPTAPVGPAAAHLLSNPDSADPASVYVSPSSPGQPTVQLTAAQQARLNDRVAKKARLLERKAAEKRKQDEMEKLTKTSVIQHNVMTAVESAVYPMPLNIPEISLSRNGNLHLPPVSAAAFMAGVGSTNGGSGSGSGGGGGGIGLGINRNHAAHLASIQHLLPPPPPLPLPLPLVSSNLYSTVAAAGAADVAGIGEATNAVMSSSSSSSNAYEDFPVGVTVRNFHRVDMSQWTISDHKIYNVNSFVYSPEMEHTAFYLVNEKMLTDAEIQGKRFEGGNTNSSNTSSGSALAVSLGLRTLGTELEQRGAVIAQWQGSRAHHAQLVGFMRNWRERVLMGDMAVQIGGGGGGGGSSSSRSKNRNATGVWSLYDQWYMDRDPLSIGLTAVAAPAGLDAKQQQNRPIDERKDIKLDGPTVSSSSSSSSTFTSGGRSAPGGSGSYDGDREVAPRSMSLTRDKCLGMLVYETSARVCITVRMRFHSEGLKQLCAQVPGELQTRGYVMRHVFPVTLERICASVSAALQSNNSNNNNNNCSMAQVLLKLFPQFATVFTAILGGDGTTMVVKYRGLMLDNSTYPTAAKALQPPSSSVTATASKAAPAAAAAAIGPSRTPSPTDTPQQQHHHHTSIPAPALNDWRTIGVLRENAPEILSRFSSTASLHEILLHEA